MIDCPRGVWVKYKYLSKDVLAVFLHLCLTNGTGTESFFLTAINVRIKLSMTCNFYIVLSDAKLKPIIQRGSPAATGLFSICLKIHKMGIFCRNFQYSLQIFFCKLFYIHSKWIETVLTTDHS